MVSSVSSNTSSISQLFAKLDSKSQGYLEKSDLVSAYSQINGSSTSSSEAADVFAALDSDSDGKVTESEFSTTLSKLKDELDSQLDAMRMNGFGGPQGAGGMAGMPPPPPENDAGFTQDELSSQLDQIGSTDSKRASFISNIVQNFTAADADGDGKVNFAEAQAYNSTANTSSSSSSSSSSTGTSENATTTGSTSANSNAQLMKRIMQLMHAYGGTEPSSQTANVSSLLSVSA